MTELHQNNVKQIKQQAHDRLGLDGNIPVVGVEFFSRGIHDEHINESKAAIGAAGMDVESTMQAIHRHAVGEMVASIALENADRADSAEEQNEYLYEKAFVDELTKVGNRAAFDRDLMSAFLTKRKKGFDLIAIDLKDFKHINDTYGYGIGDTALYSIAQSLFKKLRGGETLYRIGGDEFMIIRDIEEYEKDRRNGAGEKGEEGRVSDRRHSDDGEIDNEKMVQRVVGDAAEAAIEMLYSLAGSDLKDLEKLELRASCGVASYQPGDTRKSLKERAEWEMKKHKANQGPSRRSASLVMPQGCRVTKVPKRSYGNLH
ncbi:GGDEF domain-containing protein [Candidatus Saccharibacteria bacterium]|nr:GGDEF domain-containing protein [Candidatus Saccharibacteria bacterium]